MGASHRVLIVDDEPMIRLVLRHTLEAAGYCVVEATNGHEALAIVEADGHGISAVFSDVSMPVMDGFELARTLRCVAPTVPVVLASGGYAQARDEPSNDQYCSAVVDKPFSRVAVLTAIESAIAAG